MKNILSKLSIVFLLALFSINSFASSQKITNKVFSMNLPAEMKLTFNNQDNKNNIYQFVFQAAPFGDRSPQQLRITAVGKAPRNPGEFSDWKTKILGANIAMFAVSYQLDLSKQGDVLGKKPEKVKLGSQTFTAVTMAFGTMQACFMVTTTKNSTYNVTLISIDKNTKLRKAKMQILLDSIKSLQYFGAK